MNTLEVIGLVTLIWIAIVVLGKHQQSRDELRKHQQHLDTMAMFIAYRLAVRRLHQQHQEPSIREALRRVAEHIYGGI